MEAERLIDNLFSSIRDKAQRAIAFSNDEKVRAELLGLLENITLYELKIHRELSKAPIEQVLFTKEIELTEDIVGQLGAVTKIVNIEDGDLNIEELEH